MNIENLTTLSPTQGGYILDPSQPILARAVEIKGPHRVVGHQHPRAQLMYAIRGVLRVVSEEGTWIVPTSQAVWIPSNVVHEIIATDSVSIRTLFVDPSVTQGLPSNCCVLNVPPLLRELILKAVEVGDGYSLNSVGFHVAQVILDLLHELQPAPLYLPLGRDPRLKKIIDALFANPGDERGLDEWAQMSGASARTLARLFLKETGMRFHDWRKQLRLLEAIDRLGQGQSVTQVALDLGYQSSSAFVAMFRRSLGKPPGGYFRDE